VHDTAQDGGDGGGDVPQLLDEAGGGQCRGGLLRGIDKEEVERGARVLAKPGSIQTPQEVQSGVYVLTKEEGGGTAVLHTGTGRSF